MIAKYLMMIFLVSLFSCTKKKQFFKEDSNETETESVKPNMDNIKLLKEELVKNKFRVYLHYTMKQKGDAALRPTFISEENAKIILKNLNKVELDKAKYQAIRGNLICELGKKELRFALYKSNSRIIIESNGSYYDFIAMDKLNLRYD